MPHPPWNECYALGNLPWDTGEPDPLLVELVESGRIAGGRALEVGCGTGTNAIWLCQHGFAVLGIDVSPLAVEQARAKLERFPLPCQFVPLDFLADAPRGGPFHFVFDRGCFHVFDEAEQRSRFAARVASVLVPGGLWLSLSGSTEGEPRDSGPPRRSARDLVEAIEPELEVIELRSAEFHAKLESPPKAWFCLSRRRTLPAQPSSRHG
jgi:SAM-dependent methyltransferase